MDKLILKTPFIDHTTMQAYAPGADVSHISDELKKFLKDGGHIEGEVAGETLLKASELVEKINAAETAEEVDAFVSEDETRTTVLKAAEAKKAKLAGQ